MLMTAPLPNEGCPPGKLPASCSWANSRNAGVGSKPGRSRSQSSAPTLAESLLPALGSSSSRVKPPVPWKRWPSAPCAQVRYCCISTRKSSCSASVALAASLPASSHSLALATAIIFKSVQTVSSEYVRPKGVPMLLFMRPVMAVRTKTVQRVASTAFKDGRAHSKTLSHFTRLRRWTFSSNGRPTASPMAVPMSPRAARRCGSRSVCNMHSSSARSGSPPGGTQGAFPPGPAAPAMAARPAGCAARNGAA
mmetsp:Transcript_9049/g.26633  ORF Transcript_9049/g.26633 Transcript_9049/m.26633 type:complete len:251 (-) Transcript_9049:2-754(-)